MVVSLLYVAIPTKMSVDWMAPICRRISGLRMLSLAMSWDVNHRHSEHEGAAVNWDED